VRRLFWLGVGAAGGYYVARRGPAALERARERGVSGNVSLAAESASKVARTAQRAATTFVEEARAATAQPSTSPDAAPSPAPQPTSTSREVRP
jgi:hypothetical protein